MANTIASQLDEAQKRLSVLEVQKGLGGDVQDEINTLTEVMAGLMQKQQEAKDKVIAEEEAALQRMIDDHNERIQKGADDIKEFNVDALSSAVSRCLVWRAIGESLQYSDVSSEAYIERLVNAALPRQFGDDQGSGTNPEFDVQTEDRLERAKAERDEVQVLRKAVERFFQEAADDVPPETNFKPILYRRSDQQLKLAEVERRQAEWQATKQKADDNRAQMVKYKALV